MGFRLKWFCVSALVSILSLCLVVSPAMAGGKKKTPRTPAIFDIDKRKRAKKQVTPWLHGSLYASARFLGENERARDDNVSDTLRQFMLFLGVVGRAELGPNTTAFLNVEIAREDRYTESESFGRIQDPLIKEALVSFSLGEASQLSVGRLRFSDRNKWVADASVDGLHFVTKSEDRVFEFAAVTGTRLVEGDYLIAHTAKFTKKEGLGAFAVAENTDGENTLHLAGYYYNSKSDRLSYQINVGALSGAGANGKSSGVGLDFRAIKKLKGGSRNPQITFGFAYGSEGFRQTGLHSNKTYDKGQTQFHRYGYVYQPELSNIAIGTIAYGLRPSREFSIDFGLHAYLQPHLSTQGPDARIAGATNGTSGYLGSEVSIAGAWRPNKKSKVEFGVARFFPGTAYLDRSNADRIYAKFSYYF